jgi:signal transduction histidine kinase
MGEGALPAGEGVAEPVDGPRVERLRATMSLLCVIFLLLVTLIAVADPYDGFAGLLLPGVLGSAALVLAACRSVRCRPVALALVGSGLVIAVAAATAPPGESNQPGMVLAALAFTFVVTAPTRAAVAGTMLACALYVAGRGWAEGSAGLVRALDDSVLAIPLVALGAGFLAVLVRVNAVTDHVEQRRLEADLESALTSEAQAWAQRMRSLLHNEVIAALMAVAEPALRAPEQIVAGCRRAVDAVRAGSQPAEPSADDLRGLITAAIATTSLDAELIAGPGAAHHGRLTAAERRVLAEAVGEVLRNVERHARTALVTVTWSADESGRALEVRDHGPGLVAGRRDSWGLRHAVIEPMQALGGEVEVASVDGHGTTVTLRWPHARADARDSRPGSLVRIHRDTMAALGHRRRLVVAVAGIALLPHLYLGIRHSWGSSTVAPQLATGLAAAVIAGVVALRLTRGALSAIEVVGTAALIAGTMALGLHLAGPQSLTNYESWIVGALAVALTVLSFFLPRGWVVLVLTPSLAVLVTTIVSSDDVRATEALGNINALLTPTLLAHLLGSILRSSGRQLEQERARMASLTAEAHRRHLTRHGRDQPAPFVRGRVLELLERVVLDPAALGDPAIRRAAYLMSHEVRDEMMLPEVIDEPLRRRISRARRNGTQVVLERSEGEPTEPAAALRLLDRLLDHADGLQSIVVELPVAERAAAIAVVPALDDGVLDTVLPCAGSGRDVHRDDFSTRIVCGAAEGSWESWMRR